MTVGPDVVWGVVLQHVRGQQVADPLYEQIIWQIRVPRVLMAAVIGAALGVAGVALQGLVRNPLADPYVLGVSSGAALGAVIVIGAGWSALAGVGVSTAAFVGAVLTLVAVYLLAQRGGQLSDTRLVLAGVALAYLATAGTSLVQLRSDPNLVKGILFWLMGSVSGATWAQLGLPTLAILACTAWLFLQARGLNALALGDDEAAALGVDVHRLRIGLLVVASLLTALAVSVAGGIGFVGLMGPYAVRLVVGSDYRRVLPTSMLAGALFLVLVDLATRTVDRPNEYPITVFTAAIGAPFFLWLMRRQGRGVGV